MFHVLDFYFGFSVISPGLKLPVFVCSLQFLCVYVHGPVIALVYFLVSVSVIHFPFFVVLSMCFSLVSLGL